MSVPYFAAGEGPARAEGHQRRQAMRACTTLRGMGAPLGVLVWLRWERRPSQLAAWTGVRRPVVVARHLVAKVKGAGVDARGPPRMSMPAYTSPLLLLPRRLERAVGRLVENERWRESWRGRSSVMSRA